MIEEDKTFRKGNKYMRIEMTRNRQYKLCGIELKNRHSFKNWQFSLNIPYIVSLYFTFRLPFYRFKKENNISLSIHDNSIWWELWVPWGEWHSKTPKWRHGCFHVDDFLLGKSKYSDEIIEEREVEVPMPEGTYRANATLKKCTWTRKRGRPKSIMRVEINMIEAGIPFEGKGENSWDCGPDATHGITTAARTIAEGVGNLVGSVLRNRVKNGGYKDWNWKK